MNLGNPRRRGKHLADRNVPISLVRSRRVPDESPDVVGWIRALKPYANLWTARSAANQVMLKKINADDETEVIFRFEKREDLTIENRDFVVVGDDVFDIVRTGFDPNNRSEQMIYAAPFGKLAHVTGGVEPFEGSLAQLDDPDAPSEEPTEPDPVPDNPYW